MAKSLRSMLAALGFTLLGATAGLTAGAIAGSHGPRGSHGPMKLAHAISGLDLTAEQQQMLTDLREEVRADMEAGREGRGDEMKVFADAVAAGQPLDRAALHSTIDEAAAAKTAMAHKVVDGIADVYESLDDAQKAELSQMLKERRDQHERRREQLWEERGGRGER